MKKQLIYSIPILLLGITARGQTIGPSALNATGGSADLSGNTYAYSIGEMTLVNTASAGGILVTQGLLQPDDNATGIVSLPLDGFIEIYPNPADQFVYLQPTLPAQSKLLLELLDATGKQLQIRSVDLGSGREKQTIVLSGYAAGNYHLRIEVHHDQLNYRGSYNIQKLY